MKYSRPIAFLVSLLVIALSAGLLRHWRLVNFPGHGPALIDTAAFQKRTPMLGETVCFHSQYNGKNLCGEVSGLPGDTLDFNDGSFYVLPGTVYLTDPDSQGRLGAVPTVMLRGVLVARLPF